MFQVPLATSSTCLSSLAFWETVTVYHDRPHLVNRRLLATSQALFYRVVFDCKGIKHISELFTRAAILYEMRRLKCVTKECITVDFLKNIMDCFDKDLQLIPVNDREFQGEQRGVFVSVRVLLPRSNHHDKCLEVVVLDKDQNTAVFTAVTERDKVCLAPPFSYELELTSNSNLRVNIKNFEDADSSHAEWLADKLFPKLISWSDNYGCTTETVPSLSLVSVDEYCLKYNELKEKYSAFLIQEWPKKTTTNPQKYIFEDLAIASYLICFWKSFAKSDIHFVDCGCGNGLLVYILNQEEYNGYGIDIRRRAIWDIYPPNVKLEVGTVTPDSLFPESTWLIGNHSDQLTPWLPVISLKSSPHTNFFVLPCCPYDFSGKKYIRTNTSVSQYSDYLTYIHKVSNRCRFETSIDRLRIPSTKRTCLVGIRSITSDKEHKAVIEEVDKYILERMPDNFKPRNNVEQVRNCTQLEKNLITRILKSCMHLLLQEQNTIQFENKTWNRGRSLSIADISRQLDRDDLKQMKKECGGLQTLFRNHRYIFEITNGCVKLKEPLRFCDSTKKYKNKPCWFLRNHPDGCLYGGDECAYSHDVAK